MQQAKYFTQRAFTAPLSLRTHQLVTFFRKAYGEMTSWLNSPARKTYYEQVAAPASPSGRNLQALTMAVCVASGGRRAAGSGQQAEPREDQGRPATSRGGALALTLTFGAIGASR